MELEFARQILAIQNQKLRIQNPSLSIVVGVLIMAVYLALVPHVDRTWRTTGDEPHYLLAAHSLVLDTDFDLTNNYDQLDFLAFYFSKDIVRQTRTTPAGQQILDHHLGLPVLIGPAYALGGRSGVLVFQALLAGFLALTTFKLAAHVSRNETAALLATLFVTLTPPLFLYQYLIYPELIGALLTTLVIYYAVSQDRPALGALVLVIVALVTLPWLNRRFVPLAIVLALLIAWAWRKRQSSGFSRPVLWRANFVSSLALSATLISTAVLLWFNSQLSEPLRTDFTPADGTLLWHRLVRSIGWLVDQQRGLFVYAPIFLLAVWGIPLLVSDNLRHRDRKWFILLPFLLSLGTIAVAGGFWIAWELGPRFLVVALPALAPLLALAWRSYSRYKIWLGLGLIFFAISLANSLAVIRQPELPFKSSLPLFYGKKLNLPLTELLPDLAGYARISPTGAEAGSTAAQIVTRKGEPVWFTEAGRAVPVIKSAPRHELPFGHYRLTWPIRAEANLDPSTDLLRLSAKFLGGGSVFNKTVTVADLTNGGEYGLVKYSFLNGNVDRWRTPMIFHAVSSGKSRIWARDVLISPDPFYGWVLPYLYLVLLVAAAVLTWYWFGRDVHEWRRESMLTRLFAIPAVWGWAVLLIIPAAAFSYLLVQQNQTSRTYDASRLSHLVGQPVNDPAAKDGLAWLVDPRTDPPQKAVYGPFEIYDAGRYQVSFRLKLSEPVETGPEIARLQVTAPANAEPLFAQPLHLEHFQQPNLYHEFVLLIENPRRQALSFEVDYLGLAPLVIDEVTIKKFEDG